MRVLVVGGGGREHALVWALSRDPAVDEILAAPGNAGMDELANCIPIAATDVLGVVELVGRERVDLTVVGPEAPLVAGLVDELKAAGHKAFGPTAAGARIEGSKAWARDLCERAGIPGPRSATFDNADAAVAHLDTLQPPYVVKADGLAAGKGVTIAATRAEAARAINDSLVDRRFGNAGDTLVIEEHLTGREVSVLALTDGEAVIPLVPAQDFKRAFDGDAGPNTGGMGAYSPVPWVDPATSERIEREILQPTVKALRDDGIAYRGILYAGLMLTDAGPKVLEFNCRFGDPETQAVLPRLAGGLAETLLLTAEGRLAEATLTWRDDACVTVVLASGGYPGDHETGFAIEGLEKATELEDVAVFQAGTARRDDRVVTAGGRVLAVSALGADIAKARARAYEATSLIRFDGMHQRTDIAKEAAGG